MSYAKHFNSAAIINLITKIQNLKIRMITKSEATAWS